jgi:predicted HicB family RNase H-like nuclease
MTNRQIDRKTTKQVRIDAGLHQMLKVKAAKAGMSIRTLLEGYLASLLELKNEE